MAKNVVSKFIKAVDTSQFGGGFKALSHMVYKRGLLHSFKGDGKIYKPRYFKGRLEDILIDGVMPTGVGRVRYSSTGKLKSV